MAPEIIGQARKQAMGGESAGVVERRRARRTAHCAACPRPGGEREFLGSVDAPRTEIAVLQPDIDVVADRGVETCQQLPGEFAGAVTELAHVGVTSTRADV